MPACRAQDISVLSDDTSFGVIALSTLRILRLALLGLGLLPVSVAPAGAQQPGNPTPAADRFAWYEEHVRMAESSPLKHLPWQFLGPTNISGRMTDVAVVTPRGQSYTLFVAGASGGVWRSCNEGVSWEPVFERGVSTSIGDVTIAPSNQDIVWIGTGEANIFRSSMAGSGVYKSTDGGDTWQYMGLGATQTVARIVIHRTDPDVVYVAASGHEWTNNPERGVYKTTDGGDTWEHVLFINDHTGAIDLVADPSDPDTVYVATWDRVRNKWNDPRNTPATDGSGVWKSTDAGASWRQINEGLPPPARRGRIGIDVAASDTDVVYAFVDDYEVARMPEEDEIDSYGRPGVAIIRGATVYRSDDRGGTWRQTSENNDTMQGLGGTYGWVFGQIRVDPTNQDRIYVMGLRLNVSDDAGRTFKPLEGMHGDHHGLWIDPDNPEYLVNVNDGGLAISYDAGEHWRTFEDRLPLAQFFNVGHDMEEPFRVYGSIQDHGSRRGIVDLSRGRSNISAVPFEDAPGGEGSTHAIDPTDPDVVYAAGFYGSIFRADLASGDRQQLVPEPEEGEPPLRGQWVAPFIISPHNPRVIYHGMNFLYRSMNQGASWERISDDLTYNEIDKIGDIQYQTIYSISESPLQFGLLYAGTDDGRVWTNDAAAGWVEITGELPRGKVIAEIVASRYAVDTVYMTQNGKRDDDFAPYAWKSTDRGRTWQDIAKGIPGGPINVVKEDPKIEGVLYVGTDTGAYVSLDSGVQWHVLGGGLPNTFVQDMAVHPRDDILVAATHGRGMWALDLRPIQQLTAEVRERLLHVFDVESVTLPERRGGSAGNGARPQVAVHYWLGAPSEVAITVRSADGVALRALEGSGDAGHNMAMWDLSIDETEENRPRVGSPVAAAGRYTVVVDTAGESAEAAIIVRGVGAARR